MTLTLELTDDQVAALRAELKISHEDRKALLVASAGDDIRLQYAANIMRVRRTLGMSILDRDACCDWYPEVYAKT